MYFTNPLKTALMMFMSLTMIILSLSACSVKGIAEPLRKSVVAYNKSGGRISVTSVMGIQIFAKGHGPQNLLFGNLKATCIILS